MSAENEARINNNGGLKGVGVILTIIALITGIAAIVRPMQNEIAALSERMTRTEQRIEKQLSALDIKLQSEIKNYTESAGYRIDFLYKQLIQSEVHLKEQLDNRLLHQKEMLSKEIELLEKVINKRGGSR